MKSVAWSGHRNTRGPTTETSGASSIGKKHKRVKHGKQQQKNILDVTLSDVRRVKSPLDERGILSQTFKKNTEENAKVHDIDHKTLKALEALAFVQPFLKKEVAPSDEVSEEFQEAMGDRAGAAMRQSR